MSLAVGMYGGPSIISRTVCDPCLFLLVAVMGEEGGSQTITILRRFSGEFFSMVKYAFSILSQFSISRTYTFFIHKKLSK